MPSTVNLGRVGYVSKGAWVDGIHKINDVVTFNYSTYACIQAHISTAGDILPTDTKYWELWVDANRFELSDPAIQEHLVDTDNPHAVTKAQVGLSNVDNTSDMNKPLSNAAIELRDSVNQIRADKYLASQDIASMIYSSGILTKIQYNNPSDIDYEVLSYSAGALTNIAHFVNTVLKGNTVLSYIDGSLSSVVFMEV